MDDKTLQQLSKEITRMRPANMSDIEGIVSAFLSALKDLKKTLEDKMDEHKSEMSEYNDEHKSKMEEMHDCVSEMESELDEMLSESKTYTDEQTKSVLDKYAKIMSEIKDIKDNMPSMPDLSDINLKIEQAYKKFEEIENRKPEEIKPEFIRDQLEAIEVEDEKLKIEAIGFLRKELDDLKAKISSFSLGGGKTMFVGGGGRAVRSYDLSSQLNGVTKTFNLPAMYRIISVHSSSTPFTFRQTTDYTWTTTSITFTSEVNAATTLNTGQSITIIYSE
jgi:hypothetical protein